MAQTMTSGAPWKHTLRFALPVLAGSLLQQLYNTADTIIVGRFSGEAAYGYMWKKHPVFRFRPRDFSFSLPLAKRTVMLGFPISLQLVIVSFGLTFIQRAVNGFGQVMTAAFTVGQRVEMYMNLPCNAFQTTLATYTGQNVGAGKIDRVHKGARQTLGLSLLMTLCISALVWLFSGNIAALFGLGSTAAEYGTAFIRTIALINIVLSMYIPLFGVFQGTGHGLAATLVATCALTTRVIVTYALKDGAAFGHTIIWWNGLFGFGAGFCVTWGYYLSGRWKRNLK